jgi:hypothetical protein
VFGGSAQLATLQAAGAGNAVLRGRHRGARERSFVYSASLAPRWEGHLAGSARRCRCC